MLACELERTEEGESSVGEKYEFAARSAGDTAARGRLVCSVSGGPCTPTAGSDVGNLDGIVRLFNCDVGPPLPRRFDPERRLLLDALRLIFISDDWSTIVLVWLNESSSSTSSSSG